MWRAWPPSILPRSTVVVGTAVGAAVAVAVGCGIKVYRRDAYLDLPYFTSMHRYLPAFFLTYGHEIAYEPVNDRPRLRGASKYTNLGRALIGLYDLVGVSWLRKRTLITPVAEDMAGSASPFDREKEEERAPGVRKRSVNQGG